MRSTLLLAVLSVLLAAANVAGAQAYKWKDASGRTQYSDTPPPPGAKDVQQLGKVPSAPAPAAASNQPKSTADLEADFQKRQKAKQEAESKQAKAQQDEQARKQNCEQARSRLAAIDSGERVSRYNAAGERIILDDEGRAQDRIAVEKAVSQWCK